MSSILFLMVSINFTIKLLRMSLFEAPIHVCAKFRDMTRKFLVMRATGDFLFLKCFRLLMEWKIQNLL